MYDKKHFLYYFNYFYFINNDYFYDKPRVTTIVLSAGMWATFKMFNWNTEKKVAVHTVNDNECFEFIKNRKVDYIFKD